MRKAAGTGGPEDAASHGASFTALTGGGARPKQVAEAAVGTLLVYYG
ncbi:hypothetical protein [Marilutibacter chinensis]|uniref:Uncharacterized protein n=1 Tax=Marilutibacter chinensis TaxID=2912247 RepID=A0ABS9HTK6_9GAMM|nr:hypothetical protein [Lysobacter chinensis]MCF7222234.1 hypothetical protein [Lysobacter chinensis]